MFSDSCQRVVQENAIHNKNGSVRHASEALSTIIVAFVLNVLHWNNREYMCKHSIGMFPWIITVNSNRYNEWKTCVCTVGWYYNEENWMLQSYIYCDNIVQDNVITSRVQPLKLMVINHSKAVINDVIN